MIVATAVGGILFPLLIALLVPFRFWLGRWFEPAHLELLDAEEETDERMDAASMGDFRPQVRRSHAQHLPKVQYSGLLWR